MLDSTCFQKSSQNLNTYFFELSVSFAFVNIFEVILDGTVSVTETARKFLSCIKVDLTNSLCCLCLRLGYGSDKHN